MDTIYALASARGKAGVSIVRISGPSAFVAAKALVGELPRPRFASLRRLVWRGEVLDDCLVVVFEAGASFTGEDVVEFQLHGSQAVVGAVLRALSESQGLRLAEAGEFTRRAMDNGRLDLTQVEGLADLIDAETEAQRRQAYRVLSGSIGDQVEKWRRHIVRAGALIEATIDFADEDVPVDVKPEVLDLIDNLTEQLKKERAGAQVAERLRDGFEVAIVGQPNVGKSTLLNALAGRDVAITSEFAGTTRDVIEVRMDISGLPVTILDTAGLRDATDSIEAIGVERAIARAKEADLRIFLLDKEEVFEDLTPSADDIIVFGKADTRDCVRLSVSGKTGEGIPTLLALISEALSARVAGAATITRERHRIAMERTIEALDLARFEVMSDSSQAEIIAEHLRGAAKSLESLIGKVDVESLLGEIFASFCIGK